MTPSFGSRPRSVPLIRSDHLRAGFRVLRRHLRYAGANPRKLFWVARRALRLAREGEVAGVLERHVAEEGYYADYAQWCSRYEPAPDTDFGPRLDALSRKPRFSILLPVYDPPVHFLAEAIASVRGQCYPVWELCIVDDASTDVSVHELIEREAAADPRIVVSHRRQNGGIAQATNDALRLAQGEYCAFLDHDDTLSRDALLCVSEAIARSPESMLLFSDEDKLDAEGRRVKPFFKPAWDSEWIRTANCVLHLTVVRTDVLRDLGGLALGIDGAQDWDVVLRVAELAGRERIRHVPRVLYHWRELAGSTAAAAFEKPNVVAAQRAVIAQSLARRQEEGEPRLTTYGWHIDYALPTAKPLVSIVIPTRDRRELLQACIESLEKYGGSMPHEIVLVDNDTREPAARAYLDRLASTGAARIVTYSQPFNYAAQCNLGVREARGEMIALVNNDIETTDAKWLDELVSLAARPDVGLVGATLYYPDGTLQHAGVVLGLNGIGDRPWIGTKRGFAGPYGRASAVREVSAMITACAVVSRARYLEAGGMNEALAVSANDLDLCLRLSRAGYRNLVTPYAQLIHRESASRGYLDDPANAELSAEEDAMFRTTWSKEIADDSLYNPNLTLKGNAYALAWPPRAGYSS